MTVLTVCFSCAVGVPSLEVDSVVEYLHRHLDVMSIPVRSTTRRATPMTVSDLPPVLPGAAPAPVSPGIGVGLVFDPTPSVDVSGLSRCRMRVDRPGLNLRAGETVLCAPYEPSELGMVVLVRCEADGHAPGALISAGEVDHLESASEPVVLSGWDKPGTRY